jgi:DNA repair protein RadC
MPSWWRCCCAPARAAPALTRWRPGWRSGTEASRVWLARPSATWRAAAGVGRQERALAAAVEIGRRLAARRLRAGSRSERPADVYRHFHPSLRHVPHERFLVVLLDGRHRVLRQELVSQGTLTASLVHPREVFRPALREAAAALILVHNHPSGDPTPSREDREVTARLRRAGEILGVPVLDGLGPM